MVNLTPDYLASGEKTPVSTEEEAGWIPELL